MNYGSSDVCSADLPATREFAGINYGPWNRLDNDRPFVDGIGPRPAGAQFYPADMSKAEFEQSPLKDKPALNTLLRRDAPGQRISVPYPRTQTEGRRVGKGVVSQVEYSGCPINK